jgi:predicted  nucleic acid-binding Zn-ribbon protein
MAETRLFQCLRCRHGFTAPHDPKAVVERTCPRCGSNSVRLAPATTSAAASPGARTQGGDGNG